MEGCGSGLGGEFIDGLNWENGSSSAVAGDREQLTGMSFKLSEGFTFLCLHSALLR